MLVNIRFQVLFHSPSGVLFTFPSQYYSSIGRRLVFRLGGWSPLLQRGFLVSAPTLGSARLALISTTSLSLSSAGLPMPFVYLRQYFPQPATPSVFLPTVWPLSLSLATTREISFDFSSSAYLDVSVRRVPPAQLFIHCTAVRC